VPVLEARCAVRTADGALVFVENRGLRAGPPDVLARLARGEHAAPSEYHFRTSPASRRRRPGLPG